MAENPFTTPHEPGKLAAADYEIIAKADPQIMSGANWFWWIAGLSLVNTVLIHSGSDTSFVIGLGFTLIADAVFRELKPVAFAIDFIAIGTIFGLGWYARKGHFWAFLTGIILYAIDALIYLPLQAWMSVGFHVFALFFMFRGMKALKAGVAAAKDIPAASPVTEPPPAIVPPAGP